MPVSRRTPETHDLLCSQSPDAISDHTSEHTSERSSSGTAQGDSVIRVAESQTSSSSSRVVSVPSSLRRLIKTGHKLAMAEPGERKRRSVESAGRQSTLLSLDSQKLREVPIDSDAVLSSAFSSSISIEPTASSSHGSQQHKVSSSPHPAHSSSRNVELRNPVKFGDQPEGQAALKRNDLSLSTEATDVSHHKFVNVEPGTTLV